jgi:hypothetical protein
MRSIPSPLRIRKRAGGAISSKMISFEVIHLGGRVAPLANGLARLGGKVYRLPEHKIYGYRVWTTICQIIDLYLTKTRILDRFE